MGPLEIHRRRLPRLGLFPRVARVATQISDFLLVPANTFCSLLAIAHDVHPSKSSLITTFTVAMADGFEQALSKIRPHTSSSLAHQKAPAVLLQALEATFREQNTEKTPTAYFAALLTTLDSTLQTARASGPSFGDGDVLPAELYLLALITPYVPHPVIRTNLNTILSLTVPLFPALVPHAPPLRSQLTIYASVLHALERSQLETPGLRQAFGSLLHLCLDPRPKVRKKAAELVKDVLASPPPPSLSHPYADRVAEWTISSLGELVSGGIPKFKGKKAGTDGTDTAIHLLAFLRPVLSTLPSSVSRARSS